MTTNQHNRIITSEQFYTNKRELLILEKENCNRIILIPRAGEKTADKNWYEIGDHSALIYYYEICEKLGEKVNFTNDTMSYYDRYETGLICMNGLTRIKMLIKKSGLYHSETQIGDFHVFILNRTFSPSYFHKLEQKEFKRRSDNNEIIPITFADSELYILLRNISANLHRICNAHFDRLSSRTNGKRIVTLIDKILRNYQIVSQINNNPAKKLQYWQEIYKDIHLLSLEVQISITINIMNSKDGILVCGDLKSAFNKISFYYKTLDKTFQQEKQH